MISKETELTCSETFGTEREANRYSDNTRRENNAGIVELYATQHPEIALREVRRDLINSGYREVVTRYALVRQICERRIKNGK